jgi:hypothetical protein
MSLVDTLGYQQSPEHHRIADAALWDLVVYCLDNGQTGSADQLVTLAWELGCRHPDIAERCCRLVAVAGDEVSLRRALDIADEALAEQDDSTHEGWHRLLARARQVRGRLDRMRFRHSGHFDADGNPIPLRIHHPDQPKRPAVRRFQRQ